MKYFLMCIFLSDSLFNLYNLLDNPYCRVYVYMAALKLAIDGKVIQHIIPSFQKIDSFVKEWDLGVHDKRELFLAISNVFKEHKRFFKQYFLAYTFNYIFVRFYVCCFDGISAPLRKP